MGRGSELKAALALLVAVAMMAVVNAKPDAAEVAEQAVSVSFSSAPFHCVLDPSVIPRQTLELLVRQLWRILAFIRLMFLSRCLYLGCYSRDDGGPPLPTHRSLLRQWTMALC